MEPPRPLRSAAGGELWSCCQLAASRRSPAPVCASAASKRWFETIAPMSSWIPAPLKPPHLLSPSPSTAPKLLSDRLYWNRWQSWWTSSRLCEDYFYYRILITSIFGKRWRCPDITSFRFELIPKCCSAFFDLTKSTCDLRPVFSIWNYINQIHTYLRHKGDFRCKSLLHEWDIKWFHYMIK